MTAIALQNGLVASDSAVVSEVASPISLCVGTINDVTLSKLIGTASKITTVTPNSHQPKFCFPKNVYVNNKRVVVAAVTGNLHLMDVLMDCKKKTPLRNILRSNSTFDNAHVFYFLEGETDPTKESAFNEFSLSDGYLTNSAPRRFHEIYAQEFGDFDVFQKIATSGRRTRLRNTFTFKYEKANLGEMLYSTNSTKIRDSKAIVELMSNISAWYAANEPYADSNFLGPIELVKLSSLFEGTINGSVFYATNENDVSSVPIEEDRLDVATRFHVANIIAKAHVTEGQREAIRFNKELKKHSEHSAKVLDDFILQKGFFEPK